VRVLHPPILETRTLRWSTEADAAAFAKALAGHAALANAFIELRGPLGAGKTTFVRHLLRALGVAGRIKSPTYAVMEPYEVRFCGAPLAISHFDFYRFGDEHEFTDAGLRDVFARPGLKLAEWPEQAGAQLPAPDLLLDIQPLDDEVRSVTATAHSAAGLELLA
jgi:tRNA threonylcarbamoyladenosine biosynthesis protein TsaE